MAGGEAMAELEAEIEEYLNSQEVNQTTAVEQ